MCALIHVLYTKAHGEQREARSGSARFATTYEQLTVALAQRFGIWGPVPADDSTEREKWVKDHRPLLYDWLELARRARLITHDSRGVRDNANIWWRTEITVLGTPELPADSMRAAAARIESFADRERDRQRRGRQTPYAAIFAAAKAPTKAKKKRAAVGRAKARYHARRRGQSGNSGGPFRPTVVPTEPHVDTNQLSLEETPADTSTPTNRTSVRGRKRPGSAPRLRRKLGAGQRPSPPQSYGGKLNAAPPPLTEGRRRIRGPCRSSQTVLMPSGSGATAVGWPNRPRGLKMAFEWRRSSESAPGATRSAARSCSRRSCAAGTWSATAPRT